MTPTTHIQVNELANRIARVITEQMGEEAQGLEVECGRLIASVDYTAEMGYDKGDYWTAPCSWIAEERVEVTAVWDAEEGTEYPEMVALLNEKLN